MSININPMNGREISQLYAKNKAMPKTKNGEAAEKKTLVETLTQTEENNYIDISEEGRELQGTISQEELEKMAENADAQAEGIKDMGKMIEIARRICKGDHVPPKDEQKLMEYNFKMYMAAKNMANMVANKHPKDWESLFDDDEEKSEVGETSEAEEAASLEAGSTNIVAEVEAEEAVTVE